MSLKPPRPPPPPRAISGQHPAVQAYREKLESVNEHQVEDLTALDTELQAFLESVRTIPPPPEPDDEPEAKKDPT